MSSHEIQQVLVMSTSHITKDNSEWLHTMASGNETRSSLLIAEYDYGFFIGVPEDKEYRDDRDIPYVVRQLMHYAYGVGVTLLRLDTDGPVVTGLPTFDW